MSQGVYINTLNTYVGTALYEEFLGEKPEESEWAVYSTYFEKEDSSKPAFVKKMMKPKSKPGLFRKYILDKFDVMIYDMHSGRLDDIKQCINALTKAPLEKEKTVIMLSSVLSWGKTPPKMVEDKPKKKSEEDMENNENEENNNEEKEEEDEEDDKEEMENMENNEENEDENLTPEEKELKKIMKKIDTNEEYFNNEDNKDELGNEIEVLDSEGNVLEKEDEDYKERLKKIKINKRIEKIRNTKIDIKYKRVGYKETDFEKRVPSDCYVDFKNYEDELLKLKFENLTVYVVCAGVPYGNAQTVFNYHFKSAWNNSPKELPYLDSGENIVPTIHVKDLSKIVKLIIEKKPEQKYIFAFDRTKNKSALNLIQSISRFVGSGLTQSIPSNQEFIKNLNFNNLTDHYIDPEKYKDKNMNLILTENELNWQVFLSQDIMLKPTKLYTKDDFQLYCKDFNKSIPKLLKEFCKYRQLRPLKIVLNCEDEYVRCVYAERLAKFYNIPIININTIINMLSIAEEDLNEEELFMYNKYIKLIKKLENLKYNGPDESDPTFDEEEVLFDVLKELLSENNCLNRGYVLEGIPENLKQVERLYNKKVEIKKEDDDDGNEENEEMENAEAEENEEEEKENEEMENNVKEKEDKENMDNDNNEENENEEKEKKDEKDKENKENKENNENNENEENEEMDKKVKEVTQESIFIDKQDAIDEEIRQAELQAEIDAKSKKKKKKKETKKKIKKKNFRYVFLKKLLPESVISIGFKEEIKSKEKNEEVNPQLHNKSEYYGIPIKENQNNNNIYSGKDSQNTTSTTITEKNVESKTNIQIKNPFWEVEAFYQQNNIEILNTIADKNQDEIMEIMRIYIERNGRPYNYFNENETKILQNRDKMLEKKFEIKTKHENKENDKLKQEEQERDDLFWEKINKRIENIRKDKDEILSNNENTRKFLLLNIMPILTKGMLEVCKIDPIDPIDYLADYLFEKSTG